MHAYWSLKLDESLSYLTTFGTPFGLYRYLRLPFRILASSDLFQMKVNEIFEGLAGVAAIVDDILIYGRTLNELCAKFLTELKKNAYALTQTI